MVAIGDLARLVNRSVNYPVMEGRPDVFDGGRRFQQVPFVVHYRSLFRLASAP